MLAKQLGLTHVYVLLEQGTFYDGLATEPFKRGAKALGVGLAGESTFKTATADAAALADAVARSHADGVVLGADAFPAGVPLVKALRARLGPRVPLMATGIGFDPPLPAAARGVYVASTDVPRSAAPLTAAGKRFAREAGEGNKPKLRRARERAGGPARAVGDRALGRDARVGPAQPAREPRDRRHPRLLPLRPQRRHRPAGHADRAARRDAPRRADRGRGLRPPDHDSRAARAAVALLEHPVEELERAGGLSS